jgi:hypothetical protein
MQQNSSFTASSGVALPQPFPENKKGDKFIYPMIV